MKLLTEDGEIVEGELIDGALIQIIDDINNGILALGLYDHQKQTLTKYLQKNYEISFKESNSAIADDMPSE